MKKPFKILNDPSQPCHEIESYFIGKLTDIKDVARVQDTVTDCLLKKDFSLIGSILTRINKRNDYQEMKHLNALMDFICGKHIPTNFGPNIVTFTFIGESISSQDGTFNHINDLSELEQNIAAFLQVSQDAISASPKAINPYQQFEEGFSLKRYLELDQARNFIIDADDNVIFPEDSDDESQYGQPFNLNGEPIDSGDFEDDESLQSEDQLAFDDEEYIDQYHNPIAFDVSFNMEALGDIGIQDEIQLKKSLDAFFKDEDLTQLEATISMGSTSLPVTLKFYSAGGVVSVFQKNGYYLDMIDFSLAYQESLAIVKDSKNLAVAFVVERDFVFSNITINFINKKTNKIIESYEAREMINGDSFIKDLNDFLLLNNDHSDPSRVLH